MPKCSNCGRRVSKKARRCPNCGEDWPAGSKKIKLIRDIAVGALLVIVLVAFYFLL